MAGSTQQILWKYKVVTDVYIISFILGFCLRTTSCHIDDDSWLIIHSDGMNNTASRGGGGGIDNDELAAISKNNGMAKP